MSVGAAPNLPRLLLLLGLMPSAGCVAHRSGEAVRGIRFAVEGRTFPKSALGTTSNRALRAAMQQRVSPWTSRLVPGLVEPAWLERARLEKDGRRLEVWLAARGYFDAELVRWEVTPRGREGRKMQPVRVRGVLDLGEASRVRSVEVVGLEAAPEAVQRQARAAVVIEPGRVFDTLDYTRTTAALETILLDRGFAFVEVTGRADAFPEEHSVDVRIEVALGPVSSFGPVTLVGAVGVPERVVRDAVTFEEGTPFTPRALVDTRAALFALRVFSSVNVIPSLEDPASGVVPVHIELKRARTRRIKIGPGLEAESGKGTAYVAVEWENTNLLRRLWRFKATLKPGVAGVVAQDTTFDSFALSQVTVAPVVDFTNDLTIPHVPGPHWSFDLSGRVQLGVETGYRFFSPEVAPGLLWHPLSGKGKDSITVGMGYRIRYFDYFGFSVDVQDIEDSPLGLDLTDPYLLSALVQSFTWDGRDDPLSPTRGGYASLALVEAGGPVLGNFNFVRVMTEGRAYLAVPAIRTWNPHLIVAGRVGGGVIGTYGSGAKASVPYAERLYLGGGTSVRGWGANRLGPSVTTTDPATGDEQLVPAGGLFDLFGNLELRKAVAGGVSIAAFTDVGRVWPTLADARVEGLQWSAGGGLRYATVIGPIRGDVAFRLGPDTPDLPSEPRWTLHFGLSEAF